MSGSHEVGTDEAVGGPPADEEAGSEKPECLGACGFSQSQQRDASRPDAFVKQRRIGHPVAGSPIRKYADVGRAVAEENQHERNDRQRERGEHERSGTPPVRHRD